MLITATTSIFGRKVSSLADLLNPTFKSTNSNVTNSLSFLCLAFKVRQQVSCLTSGTTMQGTNHPPQANTKYLPRYQTRQRILVEIVVLIFAAGSLALGIAYSVQLYQAPWNPLDIGYLQGRNVWRDEGVPFLYCTSAIITLILSIASLILYARKWSRMIHIPLASAILQICGWVISMGLWGNCHFGIKYDDWDDLGIRSKYPDCFFNPNATCVDYQGCKCLCSIRLLVVLDS